MADASDITRWVGVGVACVGAFAVSPAATVLLVGRGVESVRRASRSTRARLARWLPWLRGDETVPSGTGSGHFAFAGTATGTARGHDAIASETIEQKVERLRQQVDQLHDLIGDLRTQTNARLGEHERALESMRADVRDDLQELRDIHADAQRQATETDARALPVVGVGIVLSGIPDELAELPRPLWLALLLASAALAAWATLAAARDRGRAI